MIISIKFQLFCISHGPYVRSKIVIKPSLRKQIDKTKWNRTKCSIRQTKKKFWKIEKIIYCISVLTFFSRLASQRGLAAVAV